MNLRSLFSTAAPLLVTLTAGLGLLVAGLIAVVRCEQSRDECRKLAPGPSQALVEHLAAQRAELLEEPQWVDRKKGVLSIPIEQAIDLVVEEIRRDPQAATPGIGSATATGKSGHAP